MLKVPISKHVQSPIYSGRNAELNSQNADSYDSHITSGAKSFDEKSPRFIITMQLELGRKALHNELHVGPIGMIPEVPESQHVLGS